MTLISLWDNCNDSCGWIAAALAALAYGSYGVPIKAACASVQVVDPLVLQSYRCLVFFAVCWIATPLLLEPQEDGIALSPWGLVSGLLDVPGGMGGIFAIRAAGMSVAVGTWASVIVLMNFFWGILVFQERVKNFHDTCLAFGLLIFGLVGMSRYSSPMTDGDDEASNLKLPSSPDHPPKGGLFSVKRARVRKRNLDTEDPPISGNSVVLNPLEIKSVIETVEEGKVESTKKDRIVLCGGRIALTLRQCGIMAAIFNGVCSGTSLMPMHYAAEQGFTCPGFLLSFATGCLVVTISIWVSLFAIRLYQKSFHFREALVALPSWHLRELWCSGVMTGLLLSGGIVGSVVAVSILGQGVGNSLVQTKILISGLWGICYYKEISRRDLILKWFLAASVSVCGILWLSYEHESNALSH